MKRVKLSKLPKSIKIHVFKGESGRLLARLTEFDVFTEADDLNSLFFQVNDLIYTYFDIPKKYQDDIQYIPSKSAQEQLIKTANAKKPNTQNIVVKSLYSPELLQRLGSGNLSFL